ncbi:hypothetical protein RHMOL_Rhmol07G0119000 [Rhododendron molle]|uniref:Uncharacterized protein n=1 Tax=Rhododendron molle TaxID=49168 RepID=A0ACC0N0Q1_RHOML|nr:hypothetical protein RHMOL_Rhmol07G0119000 [Rhododendron molle]
MMGTRLSRPRPLSPSLGFHVHRSLQLGSDGRRITSHRCSHTTLVVYLHYFTNIVHLLVHDHPDMRDVLDVMFFKYCAFRFLNLVILGFVL